MNEQTEVMDEEPECRKGLVLRRRTEAPGNRIVIRLAEDVPRDADLYELFRLGILIEIMAVEQDYDQRPKVVVGLKASESFQIDRDDVFEYPRSEKERSRELIVTEKTATAEEMHEWSQPQLQVYRDRMKAGFERLTQYGAKLRHDIMIASQRGWNHRNNERYTDWILMKEEEQLVRNQKIAYKLRIETVDQVMTELKRKEHLAGSRACRGRFIAVAKKLLDEDTYNKIKQLASELPE